MDIFSFDSMTFMSFLLTFIRISLLVFLLPFFGGDSIPTQVKAFVCIVLTLAVWPRLSLPGTLFPAHPANVILLIVGEVLLGLILGLMVHFVFAAFQVAGQIIGFQMGFSMISLADPTTGQQLVITSFLAQTVGMAIFLAMDGHLFLLAALTGSFKIIPPGDIFITARTLSDLITASGIMFTLAIKLSAPVVICLFMVDMALGLMAKAAPQMNLLMIGFPIKIGIGLFLMSMVFGFISMYLDSFIKGIGPMFNNVMRSLLPG